MVDYSYLLDYERHEKSSSVELCCLLGLICPEDGLRRLLHGGRDATRAPRGTELAGNMMFWV